MINVLKTFCLIALILTGCAQKKRVDPFSNGALSKLSRQNQIQMQREEEDRLRRIVTQSHVEVRKMKEKQFPLPPVLTEEALYTEVIRSSQSRDLDRIDFYTGKLLGKFPQSVFADNALVLSGQLKLAMGLPAESVKDFDRVIALYPTGNKRVTALFGKAVAYRKLQFFKYAEGVLKEVKTQYPGSPEYFRVDLEEKLLKLDQGS